MMSNNSLRIINCLAAGFLVLMISCNKNNSTTLQDHVLANQYNIQYGSNTDFTGNTDTLTMDIYYPPGATSNKKYPLVMLMHSGSFLFGAKQDLAGNCDVLSKQGYIAVSINYRLGWQAGLSCNGDTTSLKEAAYRATQDGNAALRFLISQADSFAIDTNWIFIGGSSAGAVTALNCVFLTDAYAHQNMPNLANALGGLHNADNSLNTTYTIKGICSMWGGLTDSTLITPGNALPTIFFHGAADDVIPVDVSNFSNCTNYPLLCGSMCLYRQLQHDAVPAVEHLLPGGGHEPAAYDSTFTMTNTACFFNSIIKGSPESGVYYQLVGNCQ